MFKAKLSFIAIVVFVGFLMGYCQCFAGEKISLFDGKTLNGWDKNTKAFSVVDGEIIGDSTVKDAGFVIFMKHEKDYKDFTLKLKVKMDKLQDGLVNSGIMIRTDYEVDIGQWGGLYSATAAKFLSTPSAAEINKIVKQGDWNDMEITCQGPRFVIKVNGVTTVDWIETDPKAPQSGKIGLEVIANGTSRMHFKDITITELVDPAEKLVPRPWTSPDKFKKVTLFNGKNLNNWSVQGQGQWAIENGAIVGRKSKEDRDWGHLISNARFKDCIIRLQYKIDQGNSGVYVRSTVGGAFGVHGMQVETGGNDGSTMAVTTERFWWMKGSPLSAGQAKYGDWNTLIVQLKGGSISTFVNDQKISEHENLADTVLPETGSISFQLHAGDQGNIISYKDIEVYTSIADQPNDTITEPPTVSQSGPIKFEKVQISKERVESCTFGDFNGDGIQDIATGHYWFVGPDFKQKYKFREMRVMGGLFRSLDDFMISKDINSNGFDDIVVGGHAEGFFWFENPGKNADGLWKRHLIDAERPDGFSGPDSAELLATHDLGFHSGGWVDLDMDGQKDEYVSTGICLYVPGTPTNIRWWKFPGNGRWTKKDIGHWSGQWGGGIGDINDDGHCDIICPDKWFEAPEDLMKGKWKEHIMPVDICAETRSSDFETVYKNETGCSSGHITCVFVYDINQDGKNDFMAASAHGYGVYWYEQIVDANGDIAFEEHVIDSSWSLSHNLEFEDIDNDGDPDLITGKRWDGWGPDDKGASNVYWYELTPGDMNPWKRHVISYDEHIGMGCKGDVLDYDKDGDLDILATSHDTGGTYLIINTLK
jgi:hypothetical protein